MRRSIDYESIRAWWDGETNPDDMVASRARCVGRVGGE